MTTLQTANDVLAGVFPEAEIMVQQPSSGWDDEEIKSWVQAKMGPNLIKVSEDTDDLLLLQWSTLAYLGSSNTGRVNRGVRVKVSSDHDLIGWVSSVRMRIEQDIVTTLIGHLDPNFLLPPYKLVQALAAYSIWLRLGGTQETLLQRIAPVWVGKIPSQKAQPAPFLTIMFDGEAEPVNAILDDEAGFTHDGWGKGSGGRWLLKYHTHKAPGIVAVSPCPDKAHPWKWGGKMEFSDYGTFQGLEYKWLGLSDRVSVEEAKVQCLWSLVDKCLEHLATLYQVKPLQAKTPVYISAKDI